MAWTSSEERSMQRLTSPRAHTPRGMTARELALVRTRPSLLREIERRREIACRRTHAGKRLEPEATGDEFQDRRRVVHGVIDVAAARVGTDDERGDARAGAPAVAPRRWH